MEGRIKLKYLNLCFGQSIIQLRIKWNIDIEISQQTFYNMDLILFSKLVRDDALRIGIGIEFYSLGAVFEYDLSNMVERDLGTANAPLTYDRSIRLWVSATGFSKAVIYWGVKLFMALHVKTAFFVD